MQENFKRILAFVSIAILIFGVFILGRLTVPNKECEECQECQECQICKECENTVCPSCPVCEATICEECNECADCEECHECQLGEENESDFKTDSCSELTFEQCYYRINKNNDCKWTGSRYTGKCEVR
jgi:hypothetical protein